MSSDKIGSVPIEYLHGEPAKTENYSDGSEDALLRLFQQTPETLAKQRAALTTSSWAYYYHLSRLRGNVIDWYNFRPHATVLEVGAGCGAVTEHLAAKNLRVTALELTKKRALVNAHRNRDAHNLKIVVGNLQDYAKASKIKFDYIVCVGVLEYAEAFVESENPHVKFLKLLKELLQPDGVLLLAIENRLGLKYFAGAKEDHTGAFFSSLEGYPTTQSVQTFGRSELASLMHASGFPDTDFYYPFPDYKHPQVIYSDSYFPGHGAEFPLRKLPTPTPFQPRQNLFSENLAMLFIEKNAIFRDMSNSFIVAASAAKNSVPQQAVFYSDPGNREARFAIKTDMLSRGKTQVVRKRAQQSEAKEHLAGMQHNYNRLAALFDQKGMEVAAPAQQKNGDLYFEFVSGFSLERKIFEAIIAADLQTADKLMEQYVELIESLPKSNRIAPDNRFKFPDQFGGINWPGQASWLAFAPIDLNFDNIIIGDDKAWHLIDYEWVFDFPIPKDFLISRAFSHFVQRYGNVFKYHAGKTTMLEYADGCIVPQSLFSKYERYFKLAGKAQEFENHFLHYVTGSKRVMKIELFAEPKVVEAPQNILDEYAKMPAVIEEHLKINRALRGQIEQLQSELTGIKTSRGYRALEKARKIKRKVSLK